LTLVPYGPAMLVRRRSLGALLLIGLLCAGVVGAVVLLNADAGGSGAADAKSRPNIVMIIDDDQTAEQQRFLTKTDAEIGGHGVTFDNSFVSFSLCCPSRATLMTGQYAHNHGVLGDEPPAGGYTKLEPTLGNTLPVWLQGAGYYTGLVGKFLNHYGSADPHAVPPGWNEWYGTLDNARLSPDGYYAAYGYTLNENGRIVHYGSRPNVVDPRVFQTDVFSRMAADFIRRRAPTGQPFFLYVAPRDPHVEPVSCKCETNNPRGPPRYSGRFQSITAPRTPDFNEADVSDKPPDVRKRPLLTPHQINEVDALYRAQARSLLGVDDLVANVVRTLKREGVLDNTVILFTSDNGFLHGEHRILQGKVLPYEPSIRVPLLIRAPGLPQGVHRQQMVMNADLAPTILDFAHAHSGRIQDGESLIPIMRQARYWPGRGIDLEAWGNPVKQLQENDPPLVFRGVRTDRYMYADYGGGQLELYDLDRDPFELRNLASDSAYAPVAASLQRLLGTMADCAGTTCREPPDLSLTTRGCSSAAVTGPGDPQQATFYVDGKEVGRAARPPIRIPLPGTAARGDRLEAIVTSLDGRKLSLTRALRC
jgi:N-acetylglucosamine-6-sulfatase